MLFHFPGDLPDPGIESMSLMSPEMAGGFFTTEPLGNPHLCSTRGDAKLPQHISSVQQRLVLFRKPAVPRMRSRVSDLFSAPIFVFCKFSSSVYHQASCQPSCLNSRLNGHSTAIELLFPFRSNWRQANAHY